VGGNPSSLEEKGGGGGSASDPTSKRKGISGLAKRGEKESDVDHAGLIGWDRSAFRPGREAPRFPPEGGTPSFVLLLSKRGYAVGVTSCAKGRVAHLDPEKKVGDLQVASKKGGRERKGIGSDGNASKGKEEKHAVRSCRRGERKKEGERPLGGDVTSSEERKEKGGGSQYSAAELFPGRGKKITSRSKKEGVVLHITIPSQKREEGVMLLQKEGGRGRTSAVLPGQPAKTGERDRGFRFGACGGKL